MPYQSPGPTPPCHEPRHNAGAHNSAVAQPLSHGAAQTSVALHDTRQGWTSTRPGSTRSAPAATTTLFRRASASCFRNTAVPTKRHVQQHVTEVPVPVLYPSFCEGKQSSTEVVRPRPRGVPRDGALCCPHDDGTFRGHHGRFGTTESGAGAARQPVPFATKAAGWTAAGRQCKARAALPPSSAGPRRSPRPRERLRRLAGPPERRGSRCWRLTRHRACLFAGVLLPRWAAMFPPNRSR